jgi:hypothetical protein
MAPAGGGRATAYATGFIAGFAGVVIGLIFLAFFAARATRKCRMWGPITFLVLFCLGILLNLFSIFMAMSSPVSGGPDVVIPTLSLILPAIFAFICLRAILSIPKFVASPVWCQEALVNAKL